MFIKHMRLVRDITVKEFDGGRKSAFSTAVYDTYVGKEADGTPKYESTFINVSANSDREVAFLEKFGKKGSLLKFTGDIRAGKPFQNKDKEYVSAINLNVRLVEFSEVRTSNNSNSSSSSKPTENVTENTSVETEPEVDSSLFEIWNNSEE